MIFNHILCFVFVVLFLGCQSGQKPSEQRAKIFFIIGNVTINGIAGEINQILGKGDVIETGEESRVEIKLGTHSGVQVRENSRAQVYFDKKGWEVSTIRGAVLNLVDRGINYHLRGPAAVIAVRGTIFYANTYNDSSQYICACNGTIDLLVDEDIKTVSASHHQPHTVSLTDSKKLIAADVMKEHNDIEIFEFMYRLNESLQSE
jgi:hypothetical protein